MLVLNNLGNHKRGRIWLNEEMDACFSGESSIQMEFKSSITGEFEERKVVLELCLPRNNSNYALLGASFKPTSDSSLLKVNVDSSDRKEAFFDTIAMDIEEVSKGLLQEYAEAVAKSVGDLLEVNNSFPSGVIDFNIAAHGKIGSSKGLFSIMGKAIIRLLSFNLTELDEEELNLKVADSIKF
jgi:hypothetical protein